MEALKKTMFIIALVTVVSYTVRHIYARWFDPRTSVLDQFDKSITNEIKNATSLQQLEKLYANAHQQVLIYDAVDSVKSMEPYKRFELEPYKQESELRTAIVEWEAKSREIFQIRFYWSIGLLLITIGFVLFHKVNPWLGLTILITGFGELVYWTSPTFIGGSLEYERLLNNKILLSIATLILLIAAGFLTGTLKKNSAAT